MVKFANRVKVWKRDYLKLFQIDVIFEMQVFSLISNTQITFSIPKYIVYTVFASYPLEIPPPQISVIFPAQATLQYELFPYLPKELPQKQYILQKMEIKL